MRNFRRWLELELMLAVLVTASVVAGLWAATRNRLTVTNASSQDVLGLTFAVGGETFWFGDLAPGASASARFRIRHEETFDVQCQLTDGTVYVVWEDDLLGVCARLVILPSGDLHFSQAIAKQRPAEPLSRPTENDLIA